MYYFAIDFRAKIPYHLAPPQGWEASLVFEKKHSVVSIQQSARHRLLGCWYLVVGKELRPSADWDSAHSRAKAAREWGPDWDWDWVWDWDWDWDWDTQGPPKGHARATQASIHAKSFVCNKTLKKGGGGTKSPESRVIAEIARDRKGKTSPRMNSDDTDRGIGDRKTAPESESRKLYRGFARMSADQGNPTDRERWEKHRNKLWQSISPC